jgi:cellulose synthase/poly-beta-1,6-N-acetylglucosamine synthase-like glycosyltransferase
MLTRPSCCGEAVDQIEDTFMAAASQTYPNEFFKVFLLDDAADDSLRAAVTAVNRDKASSLGWRRIEYIARVKVEGEPHYAKAGNIDHGIRESEKEHRTPEFVAVLDADMLVERDWLTLTVPHLLRDPELAMICPPPIPCTLPASDPLGQDSHLFGKITEPLRDRCDATQCSGSGWVMRRKVLQEIGGWPQVTIGEDIYCSYKFGRRDRKCGYIEDKLQYGMSPDTFDQYIKQRMRWVCATLIGRRGLHG